MCTANRVKFSFALGSTMLRARSLHSPCLFIVEKNCIYFICSLFVCKLKHFGHEVCVFPQYLSCFNFFLSSLIGLFCDMAELSWRSDLHLPLDRLESNKMFFVLVVGSKGSKDEWSLRVTYWKSDV